MEKSRFLYTPSDDDLAQHFNNVILDVETLKMTPRR